MAEYTKYIEMITKAGIWVACLAATVWSIKRLWFWLVLPACLSVVVPKFVSWTPLEVMCAWIVIWGTLAYVGKSIFTKKD